MGIDEVAKKYGIPQMKTNVIYDAIEKGLIAEHENESDFQKQKEIIYANLMEFGLKYYDLPKEKRPVRKQPTLVDFKISRKKNDDVLLAPNGKPSNLTPEQYELVRTPEFKAWFGDWINDPQNASKVVDSNGEPLVVYHGTVKDFTIFSLKHATKQTGADWGKMGFYFTNNKSLAEDFTRYKWSLAEKSELKKGSKVIDCFLSIKTPKTVNARQWTMTSTSPEILRDELIKDNHDGYFIEPLNDDDKNYWINLFGERGIKELINNQYVAFYPEQIKLADGTNVTFDAENPDIRFEDGGVISTDERAVVIGAMQQRAPKEYVNAINEFLDFDVEKDTLIKADYDRMKRAFSEKVSLVVKKGFSDFAWDIIHRDNLEYKNLHDFLFKEGTPVNGNSTILNELHWGGKLKKSDIQAMNKYEREIYDYYNTPDRNTELRRKVAEKLKLIKGRIVKREPKSVTEEKRIQEVTGKINPKIKRVIDEVAEAFRLEIKESYKRMYNNIISEFQKEIVGKGTNNVDILYPLNVNDKNNFERNREIRYALRPFTFVKDENSAHNIYQLENTDELIEKISDEKSTMDISSYKNKMYDKLSDLLLGANDDLLNVESSGKRKDQDIYFNYGSDISFTLSNQIIINFSKYGNPFYQYPSRFQNLRLPDGKVIAAPSEAEIKNTLKDKFEQGGFVECPVGTKVQTLLFSKDNFTLKKAKAWLKKHGYKTDVDEKENTYRFRQVEPCEFNEESFRTIEFTDGIKAVVGCPVAEMEDGGMVAPNGKTSNLTPEQYELVRTPEFLSWFGDWINDPENASKVVDSNGEPLVVYNRAKAKIYEFDKQKQLIGWLGRGFYFSISKDEFKEYGKTILPVFLNIRKLFIVEGESPSDVISEVKSINNDYFNDDVSEILRGNNYDGIKFNHWDRGAIISCFDSTQIKLADGTNTTFNAENPDIRFENGGNVSTEINWDYDDAKRKHVEFDMPLYAITEKSKTAKIVEMTPDEYMYDVSKGFFLSTGENMQYVSDDNVIEIAELMKAGDLFEIPYLTIGGKSQEGRHRALAAKSLGAKTIPVIVFRELSDSEYKTVIDDIKNMGIGEMSEYLKENFGISEPIKQREYDKFKSVVKYIKFEDGGSVDNLGYHGGDLYKKAEGIGSTLRGTSVPFTGYYFYSSIEPAMQRGNRLTGEKSVKAVDFSQYNLLRPSNSSDYFWIKNALSQTPNIVSADRVYSDWDSMISKLKEYSLFSDFISEFKNELTAKKDEIIKSLLENSVKAENRLEQPSDGTNIVDTSATIILKALGYEGIDVRNIPVKEGDANPDSGSYGSVIFDIKEDSVVDINDGEKNNDTEMNLVNNKSNKMEKGDSVNNITLQDDNSIADGGAAYNGELHTNDGIPMVVKETGQPIEIEQAEIVITRKAAQMHCEELSKINQDGGGKAIDCDCLIESSKENNLIDEKMKGAIKPNGEILEDGGVVPTQDSVYRLLGAVGDETNYLYSKPVSEWDEYDISNWNAKKNKLKQMFRDNTLDLPFEDGGRLDDRKSKINTFWGNLFKEMQENSVARRVLDMKSAEKADLFISDFNSSDYVDKFRVDKNPIYKNKVGISLKTEYWKFDKGDVVGENIDKTLNNEGNIIQDTIENDNSMSLFDQNQVQMAGITMFEDGGAVRDINTPFTREDVEKERTIYFENNNKVVFEKKQNPVYYFGRHYFMDDEGNWELGASWGSQYVEDVVFEAEHDRNIGVLSRDYSNGELFENGGDVQKSATVIVISDRNPLSTQIHKITGDWWNSSDFEDLEIQEYFSIVKHSKSGEYFIIFRGSYVAQVDDNVIDDDISYIKSKYGFGFLKNVAILYKDKFENGDVVKGEYPHPFVKMVDEQVVKAGKDYRAIGDLIYNLSGDHNRQKRQEVISAIVGEKVPVAKSGISAIESELKKWILEKYSMCNVTNRFEPVLTEEVVVPVISEEQNIGVENNEIKDEQMNKNKDKEDSNPVGRYEFGMEYEEDFPTMDMLNTGAKASLSWGVGKLEKLTESLRDMNFHPTNKILIKAIKQYKDGNVSGAEESLKEFKIACLKEIAEFKQPVSDTGEEKPYLDPVYEAGILERFEKALSNYNETKDKKYFNVQHGDTSNTVVGTLAEFIIEVVIKSKQPEKLSVYYDLLEKAGLSKTMVKDDYMYNWITYAYDKTDETLFYEIFAESNLNLFEFIPEKFKKKSDVRPLSYKLDPSDKNLINIMDDFAATKDSVARDILKAIRFDEHGVSATNANVLAFINGKVSKKGNFCLTKDCIETYDIPDGGEIKSGNDSDKTRYPEYIGVLPQNNNNRNIINVNSLEIFANAMYKSGIVQKAGVAGVVIKIDELVVKVSSENLIKATTFMKRLGYDKIEISGSTNKRGLLFMPVGSAADARSLKNPFVLVMPLHIEGYDIPVEILDYPCFDCNDETVKVVNRESIESIDISPDGLVNTEIGKTKKKLQKDADVEKERLQKEITRAKDESREQIEAINKREAEKNKRAAEKKLKEDLVRQKAEELKAEKARKDKEEADRLAEEKRIADEKAELDEKERLLAEKNAARIIAQQEKAGKKMSAKQKELAEKKAEEMALLQLLSSESERQESELELLEVEMSDGEEMISNSGKAKPTQSEINDFIDYMSEFYGKQGLYAKDYNGGFTREQIAAAVDKYVKDKETNWGHGDSVDRELTRDKYLAPYSIDKKEAWEMTAAERWSAERKRAIQADGMAYVKKHMATLDEYKYGSHKKMIEQAIADGKPVPVEVLADYPDLVSKKEKGGKIESEKPFESAKEIEDYFGVSVNVYDEYTNEVELESPKASEITFGWSIDGQWIDGVSLKSIRLPKTRSLITASWISDKINKEKIYKDFSVIFKDILVKSGHSGSSINVYPTTYGIGVAVIFNPSGSNDKEQITNLLKQTGVSFTNEYSDAGYVYRYKISKSKENIDKIKEYLDKINN